MADPVLTKDDDAVLRILFEAGEDEWLSIYDIIERLYPNANAQEVLKRVAPSLAKLEVAKYLDRCHDPNPPPGESSLLQARLKPSKRSYVEKYLGFNFNG